jgi:hypothetical protein
LELFLHQEQDRLHRDSLSTVPGPWESNTAQVYVGSYRVGIVPKAKLILTVANLFRKK